MQWKHITIDASTVLSQERRRPHKQTSSMQQDPPSTLPALAASALSTVPGHLAIAVFVLLGVVDLTWDPDHYVLLKRGVSHDMAKVRKFVIIDSSKQ